MEDAVRIGLMLFGVYAAIFAILVIYWAVPDRFWPATHPATVGGLFVGVLAIAGANKYALWVLLAAAVLTTTMTSVIIYGHRHRQYFQEVLEDEY